MIAEKLEIRSTGRVWGDVVTTAFSTEEGAFLRGQVRMEEQLEINLDAEETAPQSAAEPAPTEPMPTVPSKKTPARKPRKVA